MSGRPRPAGKRRADLGQHFLLDLSARRLIRATPIAKSDRVIEIGAGRGALTKLLIERADHVVAVELDPYLAARLRRDLSGRAEVVQDDFLNVDLPQSAYSLVGNIPYALSTRVLRKIASASNPATDAWLVVQLEFARREFTPPPAVESAFLHLRWRGRPIIREEELAAYHRLLDTGFQQPTLRQSLKPLLSKVQLRRLASDYCFNADAAPGDLVFDQWLGILRYLQARSGG